MPLDLTPRIVAVLALLALLPHAIYGLETGMFTSVTATFGVVNILLITVMLVLAFGPAEGDNGHGAASGH